MESEQPLTSIGLSDTTSPEPGKPNYRQGFSRFFFVGILVPLGLVFPIVWSYPI